MPIPEKAPGTHAVDDPTELNVVCETKWKVQQRGVGDALGSRFFSRRIKTKSPTKKVNYNETGGGSRRHPYGAGAAAWYTVERKVGACLLGPWTTAQYIILGL